MIFLQILSCKLTFYYYAVRCLGSLKDKEKKKITRVRSFPAFKPMHTAAKSSPLVSGVRIISAYSFRNRNET